MTYRDDHDAALARADALEAQLAEEREKRRALEGQVEHLEGQVAELREEKELLANAPRVPPTAMKSALQPPVFGDEKPKVDPSTPVPAPIGPLPTWAKIIGLLLLLLLATMCRAAISAHDTAAHRHGRP